MSSKPQKGEQQHNRAILTLSTILRMVHGGSECSQSRNGCIVFKCEERSQHLEHPDRDGTSAARNAAKNRQHYRAHHTALYVQTTTQQSNIYMGFYWVRDRAAQNQFDIGWGPSAQKPWGLFKTGFCRTPPPPRFGQM
jgi:hypothetical protein